MKTREFVESIKEETKIIIMSFKIQRKMKNILVLLMVILNQCAFIFCLIKSFNIIFEKLIRKSENIKNSANKSKNRRNQRRHRVTTYLDDIIFAQA